MRAWASYVVRQLSALHSALYFGADVAFNPSRDTKKQTQKELRRKHSSSYGSNQSYGVKLQSQRKFERLQKS